MASTRPVSPPDAPGFAVRRIAADVIDGVLQKRKTLDEQLEGSGAHPALKTLPDRDRALMRRLVATVLRRRGTLEQVVGGMLAKGWPTDAPRVQSAIMLGAAQILWMDVPDHAAVDLSVRLVQADRRAAKYAGLVNAVLRRCTREGPALLAEAAGASDVPDWLMTRWRAHYGDAAEAIAAAIAHEPALDLTVKSDADSWASRLHGEALPTGTVRTLAQGAVPLLPGFTEGAWWVQDAAAALPARLFGDVAGRRIADLCAAPGGKTAQLAQAGAHVTALDRSPARLARLKENLGRLGLTATTLTADGAEWSGDGDVFDGVLIDAPCTSTGTIRRHPDIAWLKQEADIAPLTVLQARLLRNAAALLRPGGTLIYCTCSLEPEEGEHQVAALLAEDGSLSRRAIAPEEVGGLDGIITAEGDLRTLPCHLPHPEPRLAGMDGFYAARLVKS
jgi:16S rRNA (cytosine967-C5)-methyltransferase